MDADTLRSLIADDDLGLLDVKPAPGKAPTEAERLVEGFFEIQDFYRENGREPENDMTNIQEARLAMRLKGLRENPSKCAELLDLDEFGLLVPTPAPESIDDILDDDFLQVLDTPEDDIFQLRHVPESIEMPDYVARRRPCDTFEQYESLFKDCHADLAEGKRLLKPFANEQQIQQGQFFILRGVMGYVEHVGDKEKKKGKVNARLRCIFENETESDMLLRSLSCELYKDGRRVTEHEDRLMDDLNQVAEEDALTGTIYILKSLSANPAIAEMRDLYKIGFCTTTVEERIKSAENDSTYLHAPVHVVETFVCYNLNPQKLELLLHRFFGQACLNIDVFDESGRRYAPREWFVVPLAVIEEAIELMISGQIIHYTYDEELKLIIEKSVD